MTSQIRHRRLVALGIVLVAIIGLVVLLRLKPHPQRQKPQAPAPLVTIEVVTDEHPPITNTGWGAVRPRRSISLVPQVSGQVTAVSANLRAGTFFAVGEVLVEIEETDYLLAVKQTRSQVAQAEYALAAAQEEARVAREEWERTSRDALPESGLQGAEPNPLVYREPQLRQAEAGLEAARASLDQAELSLSRCRLTAPFAGRVLSETVDLGQYVRAGEVLARIYDTDVAEITVNLPDRDLAWIRVPQTRDDPVTGSQATVVGEFAGREHTWIGRAVRVGGAMDQTSRTVPVVVEVADPYEREGDRPPLLSGMFVSVNFANDPPPGSVTIPRRSLRPDDQVWVLTEDDNLQIRTVEVARAGVNSAVILAGLAPGDRLITSNLQYVIDGMPLRSGHKGGERQ